MFMLCVLYSKNERQKARTIRTKYKEIIKENPGGRKVFRTRPDRPWSPPSGYQVPFPVVKWPERGVDHPPHLEPWLK